MRYGNKEVFTIPPPPPHPFCIGDRLGILPYKFEQVEHTVHMDSYSVTLHAEACKRIWSLVSQVAGEGRDCLLQTELTFQRQQRLVEDLRSYLDAVTSRLPCRLYEVLPPPPHAHHPRGFPPPPLPPMTFLLHL